MTGNKIEDANSHCAGNSASSSTTKSKATNPFFIFLHEFRQNLAKRGAIKQMTAKQIACAAGERWRQMSADEKLTYVVWARKNRQQLDPRLRVIPTKSQHGGGGGGGSSSRRRRSQSEPGRGGGVSRPKRVAMQKSRPSYIK